MKLKFSNMDVDILLETDLSLKPFIHGKVRDVYELGDNLLVVATDRVSAFDYVLPNGIPYKGRVLTCLSVFWFNLTRDIIGNHLLTADVNEFPEGMQKHSQILKERSMMVKKTKKIDIECVVRGFISGSMWKEYRKKEDVYGISLPKDLKESQKLPKPLFTPAIKAETGHDTNISEEVMGELIGEELTMKLKDASIRIYEKAFNEAIEKGIIIADSKFEFGLYEGEPILIDELLTPDSSRIWPLKDYCLGKIPESLDKQFIRDYLEEIGWNKEPPTPMLPQRIVEETSRRYLEVCRLLTGGGCGGGELE